MVLFPHAKINLGLQVTEKRHDGFHNLISCFYPLGWYDVLEVLPAAVFSFTNTGVPVPGHTEENLCVKAYRYLQKKHACGAVRMHLHKVIPLGAGLGGGSSDAVHTLLALDKLFQLKLEQLEFQQATAELGSDCPFFLQKQASLVKGRGDILEPLDFTLPPGYLLVVYPGIHISTREAFAGLTPKKSGYDLKKTILNSPVEEWKQVLSNDFEPSVFNSYPQLRELKEQLYANGAVYASLSGSGATVYGYFREKPQLTSSFPKEYTIWEQPI